MRKLLPSVFCLLAFVAAAQDEDLRNYDHIYKDNIKSVTFHVAGLLTSLPLIDLYSNAGVELSFDDLDGDVKNYTYTIVHCDINWQPSNISQLEYLEGFSDDRIDDYRFSFKTINNFTHYELVLPSESMRWTKSGNYLLKVYEDEDEKTLAITRRFMVVDHKVGIIPRLVGPSNVSKLRTHHEIDFQVDYEKFPAIRTPQMEIRAVVMQNGRWDNAIVELAPNFTRLNSIVFDYQDKIVFPAGKEFRFVDLRSLRTRAINIAAIDEFYDRFEVTLAKDGKRTDMAYLTQNDLNGRYVIETLDQVDHDLSANYANVLFTLYSPEPFYDHEVYIFGGLTDWSLKPEFKMVYNSSVNGYVAKALLKQGFYDYAYALVPRNPKKGEQVLPDMSDTEGNWYETSNTYTILIYYHPFGERYDQLIGALSFDSAGR